MSLSGYNPYTYTRGFRNQEFHHAVLSVSGNIHTLYLDGSMVVQNVAAGNVFASYQTITNTVIGAQTTLSQAFQGTIGDVRIYNYAIPATTVSSLYRDRNLVVYYPFDTSVNNLTPNYATLVYDASLIGQPLITASSGANIGTGALALSNTAGAVATQYVITTPGIAGQVGWNLNATNGLTIACWINVAGVAGRIQRIFDIPLSVNMKGLSIDISGTNQIYSGWNSPGSGPLDSLSTAAKSSMIYSGTTLSAGAYGTRLLYYGYTGPVMRIRRNNDTNQTNLTDFYANATGNLGTAYLGTGTTLAAWLSAAGATIAYVTTWYDQTNNGNHATQTDTTLQPEYNQTSKYVDFGKSTNSIFNLPNNTFPIGNTSYTLTLKHGALLSGFNTLLSGGIPLGGLPSNFHGVALAAYTDNGFYYNFWFSNDLTSGNLYAPNNVVTAKYTSGSTRIIYVNGTNVISDQPGVRNHTSSSSNFLGGSLQNRTSNGPLYYAYIVPSALSDADRLILEATSTA